MTAREAVVTLESGATAALRRGANDLGVVCLHPWGPLGEDRYQKLIDEAWQATERSRAQGVESVGAVTRHFANAALGRCLLYTSPSPRDRG